MYVVRGWFDVRCVAMISAYVLNTFVMLTMFYKSILNTFEHAKSLMIVEISTYVWALSTSLLEQTEKGVVTSAKKLSRLYVMFWLSPVDVLQCNEYKALSYNVLKTYRSCLNVKNWVICFFEKLFLTQQRLYWIHFFIF